MKLKLDKNMRDDIKRWLFGNLLHPVVWERQSDYYGEYSYTTTHNNFTYKIDGWEAKVFVHDIGCVHTFYLIPFTVMWKAAWQMRRYVDSRENKLYNEKVREKL